MSRFYSGGARGKKEGGRNFLFSFFPSGVALRVVRFSFFFVQRQLAAASPSFFRTAPSFFHAPASFFEEAAGSFSWLPGWGSFVPCFCFFFFLFFGGASGDNDDDEGRRSAETPLRNGYAFSSRADFNGKMALVFLLLPTTL